jgi:hypothetical protein
MDLIVYFYPTDKRWGQLHAYILMTVMIVTYWHKNCFFTHITLYILELLSVGSTTANESILAPFSKQTESLHLSCERMPNSFPSMAWLGLPRFRC